MNKVQLLGRLTRNPAIGVSGNKNEKYARFTLAVDRRIKKENENQQTADFISCVAFGNSAEFVEKYLSQGTKIAVVGRIQTGSYINKSGVKVYTTDVCVNEIEFAGSKGEISSERKPEFNADADGFVNIPEGIDEELPFN